MNIPEAIAATSRAKKVYLTGAAVIVIGWFAPNGVGGVGLLLFAIGLVMSFFEGRRDAAGQTPTVRL